MSVSQMRQPDLTSPHAVTERLAAIEQDLAIRQNVLEAAAMDWYRAKRDREHRRAVAFLSAEGTVAERQAIADRETALDGKEAEALYESLKAVDEGQYRPEHPSKPRENGMTMSPEQSYSGDGPLGSTATSVTLMEKELRRAAARIWGKTGCYRSDEQSMADLLVEIHEDLVGIEAAFRREIAEVWGQ